MKKDRLNIGIVTFPIPKSGITPLSNLVDILYPLLDDIHLITGNEGYTFFKEDKRIHTYGIEHKTGRNVFTRITNYIYTQLKISYKLMRTSRNVDVYFFLMGINLLIPMLAAKLLRKKVILFVTESGVKINKIRGDTVANLANILTEMNYFLSNKIVVSRKEYIEDFGLKKHREKVLIASRHFANFKVFKIKKQINERKNVVGYVGRLSEEKGILNFVESIPKVLKKNDNVKFLIVGDGNLSANIREYLNKHTVNEKVEMIGWIPLEEIPDYLNELKLSVIPSYTEVGPWTVLEAIASGTPVLATSVGLIPDIVKDGETGFILEDNSPECIAKNIERVLSYPNLDEIVENARKLIEREYTYEAAVERYRKILESM